MQDAPTLTPFEWTVICILASIALAVIGYFVKGLLKKPEKHEGDIHQIQLDYATKDEVKAHDRDINHIKQTYVSKDELKEFKAEMRSETRKLTESVDEIKKNYLTKSDYLHYQARTEDKLETMYRILLEMKGGHGNGA
ncbi:hypothetical protein LJC60_09825 [Ruminococcaceae bacterium OttesenSCG-928-D13]|nr:hypothetical protein [Ruminococcaceae bacterium OttesenSCG-928-D13]